MINEYFKQLQIPDTVIQIGEANNVFATIKYGDDFDVEAFNAKYSDKNLYFLGGVKPDKGLGYAGRSSDTDVLKKNYFVVDFDIREEEKKQKKNIDDTQLDKLINNILTVINDDDMLSNYYMAVNSGNGLHLHYLAEKGVDIANKTYWREGARIWLNNVYEKVYPADMGCINLSRLFRIPGSMNNKKETKEVKIVAEPKKMFTGLEKIINDGMEECFRLDALRSEQQERIQSRIDTMGENDVISTINKISIVDLVCSYYPVYFNDDDRSQNFYHKGGERAGQTTGYFKDKEGNYVVWSGSTEIPEDVQGDPMSFINRHFKHKDYGETIKWFISEYPEIKEVDDRQNKEWQEKQKPEIPKLKNEIPVKTKKDDTFNAISSNNIFKMTPKPFPWIAKNLIPENALTVIAGDTGCGKSLISYYFADRISKGKEILNNQEFSTKKTNVLIVDQEMNEDDYIDRIQKISDGDNNVYVAYEQRVRVTEEKRLNEIIEFSKSNEIGLIIFDTFSKIHQGDENSNTEMTKVLDILVNLARQHNISIVAIHHHSKSREATGYGKGRGASAIVDNCASYLEVKSKKDTNEMGMQVLSMGVEQHKNRRSITVSMFGIEVINLENGKLLFEYKDKMAQANDILDKYMTLVFGYITEHPGLPKSHIKKNIKEQYPDQKALTYGLIDDCISSLIFKQNIKQVPGGRGSKLLVPKRDLEQVEF